MSARRSYLVIERFRGGDARPVYARFRERGRLAPPGLDYVASWVDESLGRCWQVMEADDPALLEEWMANWRDLVEFEVHPVYTSAEAAARVLKPAGDTVFRSAVAEIYESHLVPLIFAPYADDLARRIAARSPSRVLEIAAGTGAVTRVLATALPPEVPIVATDLNPAMLAQAAAVGTSRPVEWRKADAMELPFADGSFDAVVCQFGVMFFPDRPAAYAEVRRVLAPGGTFLFNAWDRIEENEFAAVVTEALATLYPDDPPRFLARTPHGYGDRTTIERDLAAGGFVAPARIETLARRSRAASPDVPAIGYCQGTPLRGEIEARDPAGLDRATAAATEAIARRFGSGAVDGTLQAHVVTVESGR